jgi:hypothetical protein
VLRIPELSWILIFVHPGPRISDPGSKNSNKRERWKKICCPSFFWKSQITQNWKLGVLFLNLGPFTKNYRTVYPQKIVIKLSKMEVWDPGSGKKPIREPGSGVKKVPDPGSATLLAVRAHHKFRVENQTKPRGSEDSSLRRIESLPRKSD